jgi:hypothetical protein
MGDLLSGAAGSCISPLGMPWLDGLDLSMPKTLNGSHGTTQASLELAEGKLRAEEANEKAAAQSIRDGG